jgi:hypothetical protein
MLSFTPFYAICLPFQKAPSGNPSYRNDSYRTNEQQIIFNSFALQKWRRSKNRPTFFVQLIFFPPKFFLVFWKREIFLSKKVFSLSKKGYPSKNQKNRIT